jgi:hypothetical protein
VAANDTVGCASAALSPDPPSFGLRGRVWVVAAVVLSFASGFGGVSGGYGLDQRRVGV